MAVKIKVLFRLFVIYGRMDLLWFLRDTKYCLLQIVTDLICGAGAVAGVLLVSARFGGFGGMSEGEILFMSGYAVLVDGVYLLFFGGSNMGQISRVISRGQLDHNMIQPIPFWMQVVTEGFVPFSGSSMLLFGIGMTVYSVRSLWTYVSVGWWMALAGSVAASCCIIISVIYLVSCLAFYAPVAAEEIAGVSKDLFGSLKTYPLGGLPQLWQMVFTSFVPVGLAVWLPSRVLITMVSESGVGSAGLWVRMIVVCGVLLLLTILVFKKGMGYYATYGSPRYTGFGHR